MRIKQIFYASKGRLINQTDDMVRLIIDLPRIEGLKLKRLLEKSHNSEYKPIKDNSWFCERCQKEVDGASVKYEETHENCGGRCH